MRLRFAPSPTGSLHVGGARTALFNWLLARRHGGAFVLRIEDTDRDRSRPEHVDAIVNGLAWLGLDWDEGPFFQAAGAERHRRDALALLEAGRAYRDFTPQAEFAQARAETVAAGRGSVARLPRQLARRISAEEGERRAEAGEPCAIRFKVPDGVTAWDDLVHGAVRFDNAEIEDFVVLRSDGSPTYNLAVASDDAEAVITHVVRGDDHLSNTPKQILLYQAWGRPAPSFGHLPMILAPGGRRLSKRHGAQSVEAFRAQGVLPDAMTNFLALLGWSPGTDEELLSPDELVSRFSLDRVVKKGAVFDAEKLRWLNGRHMARMTTEELAVTLREWTVGHGQRVAGSPPVPALAAESPSPPRSAPSAAAPAPVAALPEASFRRMVAALAPRSRTLAEMAEAARPYLAPLESYDPKAVRKAWRRDPAWTAALLTDASAVLARAPWREEPLEEALQGLASDRNVGAGKVFQPLRVALTGASASPGIVDVLMILGRDRSLRRVDAAVSRLRKASN